ncbi:MAG: hypothetical protein WB608_08055, partial [Terracidiphilus sp.]
MSTLIIGVAPYIDFRLHRTSSVFKRGPESLLGAGGLLLRALYRRMVLKILVGPLKIVCGYYNLGVQPAGLV